MSVLFDRITQVREQYGISIYALERAAKLSDSSLKKWEVAMPSGDKILRVANFFDVSVDYLLGNTDNPKSHKTTDEFTVIASEVEGALSHLSDVSSEIKGILEAHKLSFISKPAHSKLEDTLPSHDPDPIEVKEIDNPIQEYSDNSRKEKH